MVLSVAIIGTMKAGKSTLINAFTGFDLSPTREFSMSTIPIIFEYDPECDSPHLTIPNPGKDPIQ